MGQDAASKRHHCRNTNVANHFQDDTDKTKDIGDINNTDNLVINYIKISPMNMVKGVLNTFWEKLKTKFLFTAKLIAILTPTIGQAQYLNQHFYSKVEINSLSELLVKVDSLYIDTLFMDDNSKLKFIHNTKVIIERAFIGKNCQFDASGVDGKDGEFVKSEENLTTITSPKIHGSDGTDGKNIFVVIGLEELGSLTINTSGGKGGKGANGYYGGEGKTYTYNSNNNIAAPNYKKGGNGGDGGNAGNGGNLHLQYYVNGFTARLETNPKAKAHERSLRLFYFAGNEGSGGKGGAGWSEYGFNNQPTSGERVTQESLKGTNGKDGKKGRNGELFFKKIDN